MSVPGRLKRYVSEDTLGAIESAVRRAESTTSGEIVVHIVSRLLPFETPRRRALRTFSELGVGRKIQRNGILLFLVMRTRRFEIVVDFGIDEKAGASTWAEIASRMSEAIASEGFGPGVSRGVALLGEVLARYFPPEEGSRKELPDRPGVEES